MFKLRTRINQQISLKFIFLNVFCCLIISFNAMGQTKGENKLLVNVAILVYDGVYLLDFAGPLEVFFDTYSEDNNHLFYVYTVSPTKEFKPHCGTKFMTDFEISSCPKPDILVVPGGDLNLLKENPKLVEWLLSTANNSQTVMSVCTGAFILADAGLLDSLNVTTWHGALNNLKKIVPSANVVKGVRYTDNGKVVTTSGISAGIDGALYLVSKYFGKAVADSTAKYMDYEYWK